MMKKLIFCLLMMTGAGMLNSCQQDEVVNEAPASKGVTIRASLPNNEKSRAVLKDTGEGATQTNIYWEEGDVITLTFNKDQQDYSYTFNITDYSNNQQSTTAKFVCNENIPLVEGVKYTFTYGGANQTPVQVGTTKSALKLYQQLEDEYKPEEGDTWADVNLSFSAKVAFVEISLPNGVFNTGESTVSMYDVNTEECKASITSTFTNQEKVYFSIVPGTYEVLFKIVNDNISYAI